MSKPYSAATSCLLRGLESLLLPSSLPRLNLSGQNLTDESMEVWETLLRSAEVLDWYLSFEEQSQIQAQGVVFLDSVRGLDLSKNSLKSTVTALTDPLNSGNTNVFPVHRLSFVLACSFPEFGNSFTLQQSISPSSTGGDTLPTPSTTPNPREFSIPFEGRYDLEC